MKGNEELLNSMNNLLAEELTAISQYMVHAEVSGSLGFQKLHEVSEKQAMDEMRHAEKLIERIIFLEGRPIVSKLHEMHIGSDIPGQIKNDLALETDAVRLYNEAIKLASDVSDNATKVILEGILKDEDRHVDELEELRDQLELLGLPIFLSTQM